MPSSERLLVVFVCRINLADKFIAYKNCLFTVVEYESCWFVLSTLTNTWNKCKYLFHHSYPLLFMKQKHTKPKFPSENNSCSFRSHTPVVEWGVLMFTTSVQRVQRSLSPGGLWEQVLFEPYDVCVELVMVEDCWRRSSHVWWTLVSEQLVTSCWWDGCASRGYWVAARSRHPSFRLLN